MSVQLAMMGPTHWNGELIADFASQSPRLRKAQMVGVRRRSTTYQARLSGHVLAMILVAQPDGLGRHTAASNADPVCRSHRLLRNTRLRLNDFLFARSGLGGFGFGLLVIKGREPGLKIRFNQLRVRRPSGCS